MMSAKSQNDNLTLKCGEIYCNRCGDCIYCYGDDPCYDEGYHTYELPDPKELEE